MGGKTSGTQTDRWMLQNTWFFSVLRQTTRSIIKKKCLPRSLWYVTLQVILIICPDLSVITSPDTETASPFKTETSKVVLTGFGVPILLELLTRWWAGPGWGALFLTAGCLWPPTFLTLGWQNTDWISISNQAENIGILFLYVPVQCISKQCEVLMDCSVFK